MRGTLFNELSAFVTVAEHCSFTKAAASLGLSPSVTTLASESNAVSKRA